MLIYPPLRSRHCPLTPVHPEPPAGEKKSGEKKPEAKVRMVFLCLVVPPLSFFLQPLPPDQKEAKIAKEVAAFSNTGWDTDEDETEEPELPPIIVEKPVDVSKGKPVRRWDADKENKGILWPLVKVGWLPTLWCWC